jgi:hypothetical protein
MHFISLGTLHGVSKQGHWGPGSKQETALSTWPPGALQLEKLYVPFMLYIIKKTVAKNNYNFELISIHKYRYVTISKPRLIRAIDIERY